MTPRKWTEADVTLEDRIRFLESIDVSCPALGDMVIPPAVVSELVAACWNRLEERLAEEELDPFFDADHLAEVGAYVEERSRKKLLAQALEALRFCRLHLRHDKMCSAKISGGIDPCDCGGADMVLKNAKVIAELEKEVEP